MTYTKAAGEIKSIFGRMPSFFKVFPQEALPGAWDEFKAIQLDPHGMLTPKAKELLGLAVASQIPCSYCVYFHKLAAEFNGASKDEMNFAIAIAANTRNWSTVLTGMQVDFASFKPEVDRLVQNIGASIESTRKSDTPALRETVAVVDSKSAYADMQNIFGFVPEFVKAFPENGIAGAWKEFKAVEMDPNALIPSKVREFIALGVASQVPCPHCVYLHSELAKLNGAIPAEIQESVAMAGIVRHWSTVLSGLGQDQGTFRREVNEIFNHLKRQQPDMTPKQVSKL